MEVKFAEKSIPLDTESVRSALAAVKAPEQETIDIQDMKHNDVAVYVSGSFCDPGTMLLRVGPTIVSRSSAGSCIRTRDDTCVGRVRLLSHGDTITF